MLHLSPARRHYLVLAALALAGCSTEYVSPIPYERLQILGTIDTRWRIVGRVTTYNGRSFDVFAQTDTCVRDNYRWLKVDSAHTLLWRRGAIVCSSIEADTVLGQWVLSADYDSLRLLNDPELQHSHYQIRDLSDSVMVLRWSETTLAGATSTEVVTLRQDR